MSRLLVVLITYSAQWLAVNCFGEDFQYFSKWDERLPAVELHNVHIDKANVIDAWQEIATKYLLRANFYRGAVSDSDSVRFVFNRETTTGKDVFDALIATYPAYTYTQDKITGIIWLYPKRIEYGDILNKKVKLEHLALQLPMYYGVLLPVCRALALTNGIIPEILYSDAIVASSNYGVDLPSGIFSVRDILNLCCVQNATAAFFISSASSGNPFGVVRITPVNLFYYNPLVPPRTAASIFWETQIGKTKTGTPSLDEIRTALSDSNPKNRMAALTYLKAAAVSYNRDDLINKSDDSQKAIWAAVELKSISVMREDQPFLSQIKGVTELLQNDLAHLNPSLALITSMELAIEKNDANVMDAVVNHNFSAAEIAIIRPDLIRIARQSKLLRDKLSKMKFDDPELSPEGFHELENTNLFTFVQTDVK